MRVRLLAAVTSAALLAVAGCTSDASPEPAPLPTESASPGETSRPSPSAPTLPPEAQGTSPAAAKAFARHYFEAVNYAAATGDTRELRALGTRECTSCDAIAGNIEKVYGAGGAIRSGGWQVNVLTLVPLQPKRRPIVDVGVTQSPESVVQSRGAKPKRFPGGKQPMTMHLVRRGPSWHVSRLDLVT